MRPPHASAVVLALAMAMAIPAIGPAFGATEDEQVVVYRCIGAQGRLALRDTPCLPGERQEVRRMTRPRDPPPRPAPPPASPSATALEREVRIVTVQPPQPMYECTAPDGALYLSDDGEGNPRWVPLWATGHLPGPRPPFPPAPRPEAPPPPSPLPGLGPLPEAGPAPRLSRPPAAPTPPVLHPPGHRPHPPAVFVPTGTWVRDPCRRLSQREVCERLSDRHYEILRRYVSAMPSERRRLDEEQRRIDERMANDCARR